MPVTTRRRLQHDKVETVVHCQEAAAQISSSCSQEIFSKKRSGDDLLPSARIVSPESSASSPPPDQTVMDTDSSLKSPTKRVKRQKSKQQSPKQQQCQAPKGWEEIYSLVEELRQDRTAPCDSMGCEALPTKDQGNLPLYRFQVLVSLLLSSQTKDAMVAEAIQMMKRDGILSIDSLRQSSVTTELLAGKHLARVGFRNNKAKFLKEIVDILHTDYGDDIPPTAAQMMDLPGIGPKMAYICEAVAWDPEKPSGIGVDTHMHRLFNQLDWVQAKTPEQTRIQLESWLPLEKWKTVNLLWVGFGQEVQQEKAKILKKALHCSRPASALRLLKRCGVDLKKEGIKHDMYNEIQAVLKQEC
ncbi:hypothetical protein ACA910_003177 [Epithemia clementina (nom. ined.)]